MFVLNDEIEVVDVEWDPTSIRVISQYHEETDFDYDTKNELIIVSSEGEFTGFLYILELFEEYIKEDELLRPVKVIKTRNQVVTQIVNKKEAQNCLLGYEDGIIEIRDLNDIKVCFYRSRGHDQNIGSVLFVDVMPDNTLISSGKDGSLAIYDQVKNKEELNG